MNPVHLQWFPTDHDDKTLRPRGLREAAAAEPQALAERLPIEPSEALMLPDLSGYPTATEKARVLLQAAPDVEHMLLVEYLYAAMTLKTGDALNALEPAHQALVRDFRATLVDVAVEEMGHLMSVQNLRLFLDEPVSFAREHIHMQAGLYPCPFTLERLSLESVSKYVLAEAPTDPPGGLAKYRKVLGRTGPVQHVGVIYALLWILFGERTAARDLQGSKAPWDELVFAVASAKPEHGGPSILDDPERWHLPDRSLHGDSLEVQVDEASFPTSHPGFFVRRVAGRSDAQELVKRIGLQGEAPADQEGEASHFRRFAKVWDDIHRTQVEPAMPVLDDPTLAAFTNPEAQRLATSFDGAYARMIAGFLQFFDDDAGARAAASTLLEEQMREMRRISKDLASTPTARGAGTMASPLFTLPRHLTHRPRRRAPRP